MSSNTKTGFKVTKVVRVLRLKDVESYRAIVYKVTGPNGLVKFFNFKKNATAWVKDVTTNKPMTTDEIYNFYQGR